MLNFKSRNQCVRRKLSELPMYTDHRWDNVSHLCVVKVVSFKIVCHNKIWCKSEDTWNIPNWIKLSSNYIIRNLQYVKYTRLTFPPLFTWSNDCTFFRFYTNPTPSRVKSIYYGIGKYLIYLITPDNKSKGNVGYYGTNHNWYTSVPISYLFFMFHIRYNKIPKRVT